MRKRQKSGRTSGRLAGRAGCSMLLCRSEWDADRSSTGWIISKVRVHRGAGVLTVMVFHIKIRLMYDG